MPEIHVFEHSRNLLKSVSMFVSIGVSSIAHSAFGGGGGFVPWRVRRSLIAFPHQARLEGLSGLEKGKVTARGPHCHSPLCVNREDSCSVPVRRLLCGLRHRIRTWTLMLP